MSPDPTTGAPAVRAHRRPLTTKEQPVPTTHRRAAAGGLAALTATGLVLAVAAAPVATAAPATAPFLAPYWTELDLTGDEQVTADDLDVVAAALGATADDAVWDDVAAADTDGDGTITVADLAAVSQRMVYDDGPFELVEASVLDMQAAMNAGVTSSVAITQEYLDRIAAYDATLVDTGVGGRPLHSIITTSDVALEAAARADAARAADGMTSLLLGVPVAVKDNYDTKDMPTTGGCGCWDGNRTATDATMVDGLRADGAVVLAKASLDEFAFGFVSEFSSYQDAGTSTLVASPYVTSRTAGGSSGGTGAAIAANLAGLGFGTDTGGSIRVPSSYNQLVGVRPTVGLASRDGIIPLALSQDTGGPMARSVLDAAVALDAVVGVDPADPVTSRQEGAVPASYTQYLDADALDGARIGYVPSMLGSNATTLRLWAQTRATLESLGATVVEVTPPTTWSPVLPNGFASVLNEGSGSTNEFKHDLDEYVANHLAPQVEARTLQGIVDSGRYVPSRRSTYVSRSAITEETYQAWAGPAGSHTRVLAEGKQLVTAMLDDADLDALVYPSANPYGTIGTNLRLSPNTGLPAVTVPIGQATAADATVTGGGVNLELLGRDFEEGPLLGLAFALEQATHARTSPALYGPLG
jgi:Asp-tRNA(Asn)/Glu-tRNA(Gln) amidotransferase A subunit family amidase